jgi:hypothetical protein
MKIRGYSTGTRARMIYRNSSVRHSNSYHHPAAVVGEMLSLDAHFTHFSTHADGVSTTLATYITLGHMSFPVVVCNEGSPEPTNLVFNLHVYNGA